MTNCTAVNTPPIFQAIKETESKKTYCVFQPFSRDPYSYRLDRSIGVDDSGCLTDTTHRDIISMSLEPLEASEHIKHRRTRSGCFTCRARRVKCDEVRPTCDRCSKGNRQCTFPESAETPKSSRVKRRTSGQAGVKVGACAEIPRSKNIKEERTPISASYEISFPDEGQSRTFPKSACHIAHKSGNSWERRIIDTSTSSLNELNVDSHDFWLDFFRDNITFRHYFLTEDKHDFLHLTLPILAPENQALLFSMISLSAFHFFIGSPASSQYSGANQIPEIRSTEIFFQLHNKAIMLLRSSFQESPVPSLHGLLAVLHLSLVEEYLGQWENMIQHRRGACMILSSLFDPESINDSPEGRFVYSWVTRFDLTISMWCGLSTALEQHWYMADYHRTRLQWSQEFAEPERLVAAAKSTSQYITMQIVNLLEARFSGIYDYDTYQQAVNSAMEEIDGFWATFSPDNISELLGYLDTRAGLVSSHNLLRYTYCEVHVMKLLLQHQQSVVQSCSQDIYSVCGLVCDLIWEILHSWDNKQGLLLLPLQMTLALLAAFCKDDQLRDFLGAQFNTMECVGFVYPATYRSRISSLWQDPTIKSGWRDHAESQICLLTTIRTLAQATSDAHSSLTGNSLMRNMFSFANINPHSSQSSTSVIFDIPYTLASEDQI